MMFFRTNGFISRVVVKTGDRIKKGDILAELQVDDLLNQLQQAKIDLEVAESALEKEISNRQFSLEKAQIDYNVAKSRFDLAQIDVTTTIGAARSKALVNLDIAEQNLRMAELNLKQVQNSGALKEEQVVERQKLSVKRLESLLAERQIVAPYSGIVMRVLIAAGKQATAFNPAIEVGDPTELVIRSQLDWKIRDDINRDTVVFVSTSSQAKENYPSKYLQDFVPFTNLEDAKQTTFSQEWLYFNVPPSMPADKAKVGSSVSLNIILGRRENVLLLPPPALRSYRGLNFVIVQDGERRRRVEIYKIGLQTSDRVEIEADLNVGEKVVGP
jgi:multidrug efflux pump subunit AcrA (membrane-fusion protein)